MKITRNNYEAFFVDFVEGKLDPVTLEHLNQFLSENSDLADELLDFQVMNRVGLPSPPPTSFPGKNRLKKEASPNDLHVTFDQWAISSMEGDLSPEDQLTFDLFLRKNPDRQQDYLMFQATRLQPDSRLQYPEKSSLKHFYLFSGKMLKRAGLLSIAASLLLLAGWFFLFPNPSTDPSGPIVVLEERPEKPKIDTVKKDDPAKPQIPEEKPRKKPAAKKLKSIPQKKKPDKPDTFQPMLSRPERSIISDHLLAQNTHQNPDSQLIQPSVSSQNPATSLYPASTGLLASHQNSSPNHPGKPSEALTIGQYLSKWFKGKVLNQRETQTEVSGWDIADAGASQLNKLTNSEIKVEKKVSKNGKTVAYHIGSSSYGISRTVTNN